MTVLNIHHVDRFPGFSSVRYTTFEYFVLTIRLTNTGQRPSSLKDDLTLVLRVMPPHFAYFTPGWTLVTQKSWWGPLEKAAAQKFGGVLPGTITRPGMSTIYSYLIGAERGDSHYGLYQFDPVTRRYRLLFPTGF
jgi:hypothetical protein